MMSERKEYDYGIRTLAEQLYVFHGRTYEEISRELGVSEAQLKRWGKAAEWKQKRGHYLRSKAQDLTRIMGVKERILEQLEAEISPGTVHHLLAGFRQAHSFIESKLSPGSGDIDRPAIFLEDLRFIVETLGRLEPKSVRLISDHYDELIAAFKERHAQTAQAN